MPPFYDIYGISTKRNKKTIERFLDYFTERKKIENREGQEIYVRQNDEYGIEEILIPISTLSEVIEYGVNNLNMGFVFYIGDNLKNIKHIILKFTYDKKIIFGISIEEKELRNGELTNNHDGALKIVKLIERLTFAHKTSIQVEYPPADDEKEFDESMEMWRKLNEQETPTCSPKTNK